MRRLFRLPYLLLLNLVFFSAVAFAGVGSASSGPAPSALKPAGTGGWVTVDRALGELTNSRRMLIVGAHPDDEDTSLIAIVARGMSGDAAYLALSRGEGGQNLVGSELGTALGLLRTRELLDARAVDGGEQFFSRAIDFGYTRSLPETLGFWPRKVLLEDVVRIIRRFRPQVLVSVFPSGGGGHGQHKAAGLVAHEAFPLAGKTGAFP
ncbi:MAG TPA: PIG-L family deacetylase, partial [Thermoanaerobaculia bacterium]|nr:PIG-L family deacetylase [Thermoanaerobaculia bacterium]